jgi:hypothetical protein
MGFILYIFAQYASSVLKILAGWAFWLRLGAYAKTSSPCGVLMWLDL